MGLEQSDVDAIQRSWEIVKETAKLRLDVRCYMNLWGVAVPEPDSHPDRNKGPDHAPCACP